MQKSLSELSALPEDELSNLIDGAGEPLLVTQNGELRFVAQSLDAFDLMMKRIRTLEAEGKRRREERGRRDLNREPSRRGIVIPLRP
jgi:PHD/YefM family antitoxin component YafN of YafNO toxin-antitoxin module